MSKYHVCAKDSRTYDGICFDSKLEMKYYIYLLSLLESGEIKSIKRQVPYIMQPSYKRDGKTIRAITYKADFVVTKADDTVVVVDVKGLATPEAKLKRKMFWFCYPDVNYIWIGYSKATGWCNWDELQRRKHK